MNEVERAYTILRLEPGASLKDVIEARDDLLFLWDPQRLSERPSLRSKAARQRREIAEAADLLLEELSQGGDEGKPASPRSTPESSTSSSPSLYEEVFSKRRQKQIPWLTLAVIGAVAFSLLLALLLLTGPDESAEPSESGVTAPGDSSQEQPEEPAKQPPSQESPSSPEETDSEGTSAETSENPTDTAPGEPEPAADRSAPQTQTSSARPEADSEPSDARPTRSNRPVLLRGPEPESENPTTDPQTAPAPSAQATAEDDATEQRSESEAKQQLFDLLLENSRAARMLAGGRFEDLPFTGWEIRDEQNGESYIDLKVNQRGTTVHFIWGVHPDQKQVRPLSQAARDLENRVP